MSKTTNIVICFLLGIALPCIMLGYLAFRGIRNDQALTAKGRQDHCSRLAAEFDRTLDAHWETLCAELDRLVRTHREHAASVPALCCSLRTRYPAVEAFFTVTPDGEIRFPGQCLLYLQFSPTPSLAAEERAQSPAVRNGHTCEFVRHQYTAAAEWYEQAYRETMAAGDRARILCALARVKQKANEWRESLAIYKRMIDECGSSVLDAGVPAQAAALLEMGAIYQKTGDFHQAGISYSDLMQLLLGGTLAIDRNTFEWLEMECLDAVQTLAVSGGPFSAFLLDSLAQWRERETVMQERTGRYHLFQEKAGILLARTDDIFEQRKILLESPGQHCDMCLLENSGEGEGSRWGILLSRPRLRDQLPLKLHAIIGTAPVFCLIRDERGQLLAAAPKPESTPLLRTDLKDRFPPWSLEFYEQEQPWWETLLFSRHSIYVYMFILIGCLLLFGLILTYRTIHREMELTRIKTDFVAAVSHDIKNPLTSIRQLSEMLFSGRVPSDARRRQYYQVLVEQSERLKLLVNNILDYTKMDKSRNIFHFERINLAPVILKVITETQSRLLDTRCMIHANISTDLPLVRGDAVALEQALYNLVDNAVKFSGDTCRIEIQAYGTEGPVTVSVRDWGIGIPSEEQKKIFREFYRTSETKAGGVKGSGLGLTLVSQIIRAHGGTITVESRAGEGSTFTITIPVK
ncbi:tetratricopeptide repeat-containing sensor histidine kinase [bacterium]|nr:tetratricopeptide repeat-containing sensor histidine kinase [bacterium]